MAKRIYINKKQEQLLIEAIENNQSSILPSWIVDDLDVGRYPLNGNISLPNNEKNFLKNILEDRYEAILSNFSDDITEVKTIDVVNKLSKLISICQKKERNLRPQLEKICIETIKEMFKIPSDICDCTCHLVDNIDSGKQFHVNPNNENRKFKDVDEINNTEKEIEKRQLIVCLMIGGSMIFSNKALKYFLEKVFNLDEELPHLYSKIIKINEYLLFRKNIEITDKEHHQGGYVEVSINSSEKFLPKIEAKACIFPILLMETIKGYFEILASNALPDKKDFANEVIGKSDSLMFEPWFMRFGPKLWEMVFKDDTDEPYRTIDVFSWIMKLDTDDFIMLMREVLNETENGENMMSYIKEKAAHDSDYADFENDIKKKQDERELIYDECFDSEELFENEEYV